MIPFHYIDVCEILRIYLPVKETPVFHPVKETPVFHPVK
jgi:hypothetical protein